MTIDIFKYPWLYLYLEKFNQDIRDICGRHTVVRRTNEPYIPANGGSSWWFHPDAIRELPLPRTYPHCSQLLSEPKFNLILFGANYPSLFLINELFADRKDIFIEDYACGMGRLIYYLSKCGFKNFNCIENFSQVAECLLEDTLKTANLGIRYNRDDIRCQVVNIVGYPTYYRKVNTCVELFLLYENINYELPNSKLEPLSSRLEQNNYKFLCTDSDTMIRAYCRVDKYDEFREKLKHYEC